VGVAAFVVNYLVDQGVDISHSHASLMFAFCQLTFTGGRFFGAALLRFVDAAFLLSMYGFACMACCLGVALGAGRSGIACLYMLFFFESICYPVSERKYCGVVLYMDIAHQVAVQCIFTLGTKGLGPHTKRGSGLIVMVRGARIPVAVISCIRNAKGPA
jgi:FHS family L-fucose permease-like MFS transporter